MYKAPPFMGPWLPVADAANMLGMNVDEFCSFVSAHANDIPHRYADDPQGMPVPSKELKISPIALVCMFLLNGDYGKAQDMVADMRFFLYDNTPVSEAPMYSNYTRIVQ